MVRQSLFIKSKIVHALVSAEREHNSKIKEGLGQAHKLLKEYSLLKYQTTKVGSSFAITYS
jgi:hypothetical protein